MTYEFVKGQDELIYAKVVQQHTHTHTHTRPIRLHYTAAKTVGNKFYINF